MTYVAGYAKEALRTKLAAAPTRNNRTPMLINSVYMERGVAWAVLWRDSQLALQRCWLLVSVLPMPISSDVADTASIADTDAIQASQAPPSPRKLPKAPHRKSYSSDEWHLASSFIRSPKTVPGLISVPFMVYVGPPRMSLGKLKDAVATSPPDNKITVYYMIGKLERLNLGKRLKQVCALHELTRFHYTQPLNLHQRGVCRCLCVR